MSQGYEMQKHRADGLKGHLDTANRRIEMLEHSLSDAMEQIEAIQGSNAVHMERVAALEQKLSELRSNSQFVKERDKAVRGMISETASEQSQRARRAEARVAVLESTNVELSALGFDVHHVLEMDDEDDDLVARVTDVMRRMKDAEAELDLLRAACTLIASRNDGLRPPERGEGEP